MMLSSLKLAVTKVVRRHHFQWWAEDSGILNGGRAQALQNMLDAALLQEFIDQLNVWVDEGTLQAEDMDPLIEAAEALLQ